MLSEPELQRTVQEIKSIANSLHISRVPQKSLARFRLFAEDEFCGDYGMALKHLMDFYDGLIPSGLEHLELAIDELNSRISALEVPKQEGTKMIDGTVRMRP